MNTRIVLAALLAGSFVAAPAWAGTPSNPELTDAAGETIGALDIRSLWITTTPTQVVFNLQVENLGNPDPLLQNGFHNYYRVEFTRALTGTRYFVEAQIHGVDSYSSLGVVAPRVGFAVTTGAGTSFASGATAGGQFQSGTVEVIPSSNLVVIKLDRGTLWSSGIVISSITAATQRNEDAVEITEPLATVLGVGGRTTVDSGVAGKTYTIG